MGPSRLRDIFELVVAFDELPAIEPEPDPFEAAQLIIEPPVASYEERVVGTPSRARRAAPARAKRLAPADSPGHAHARKRATRPAERNSFSPTDTQFDSPERPARQPSPKRRPRRALAALPTGCYSEGSEGDDVRWIKATLSEWDDKVLDI